MLLREAKKGSPSPCIQCRKRKSSAKVEAARPNLVVLDSPNSLDTKEMEKLSSERPVENNTATSAGSPQPGAGKGRVHGTSSASLGGDGVECAHALYSWDWPVIMLD